MLKIKSDKKYCSISLVKSKNSKEEKKQGDKPAYLVLKIKN